MKTHYEGRQRLISDYSPELLPTAAASRLQWHESYM